MYVEVFGGGASVLLSKPSATLDVYNDLDQGLVNFFKCLRDRAEDLVLVEDAEESVFALIEDAYNEAAERVRIE